PAFYRLTRPSPGGMKAASLNVLVSNKLNPIADREGGMPVTTTRRGLRSRLLLVRAPLVLVALVLVTAALAGSSPARAQLLYGTITGNVNDSTGAALPGVTVQAKNTGTAVVKTVVTDERGVFVFSDLVSGVYDVSFELSGFRTVLQQGVRVDSNTV